MFKPVPVAIGLRYLRAKRRNGFISFVSLASILGIAIGVMVLITTLAVMSGFQREIKDRMLGMVAHATVSAHGEAMTGWQHGVGPSQDAVEDVRPVGDDAVHAELSGPPHLAGLVQRPGEDVHTGRVHPPDV